MVENDKHTTEAGDFIADLTAEYRERMRDLIDETYNEDYLESVGDPEAVIGREFPRQAWEEIYTGCLPPARQLNLVYHQGEPFGRDRDIVMGLVKQIQDEAKHGRLISSMAEEVGVEADPITWEAPYHEALIGQVETAMSRDKPHLIAAGLQLSTEIMAAFMVRNLADYIEPEYPDMAATLRADVAADEGDHIHIGRLIGRRFAQPEEFDEMRRIAREKYEVTEETMRSL
ncbi:MAG: hypothetical protein ACOC0X_03960 [Halobacteriota archaeon]